MLLSDKDEARLPRNSKSYNDPWQNGNLVTYWKDANPPGGRKRYRRLIQPVDSFEGLADLPLQLSENL